MGSTQRFHDRREAGQLLARQLADYKDRDGDVVAAYNIPAHVIRAVAAREGLELRRRLHAYRGDRPPEEVRQLLRRDIPEAFPSGV